MKVLRSFLISAASVALLAGCGGSGDGGDDGSADSGSTSALFNAFTTPPQLPIPFDLLFAGTQDTTLNIPGAAGNPLFTAANELDGWGTTSRLFFDFIGADIDLDSANEGGGVLVISSTTGALTPGVDYEVTQSSAVQGRPRLLIKPLRPLAESTTHFVIVTGNLRSALGGEIPRARQFDIVASPNAVGSDENPADDFTAQQQATLEQIRVGAIRPIFNGVIDPNPNIDGDSVILAYSFTTESIGESLDFLADNPTVNPNSSPAGGIVVSPAPDGMDGQLSTGDLGIGVADTADIFAGRFDLPYYLANDDGDASPPAPLTTFWASNGTNVGGSSALSDGAGGQAPCAAFAPSTSTTKCYPQPMQRSVETVPVLITVPNENSRSGGMPPADGWPVIIFQHGITRNRTDMFAIAPTLADAGFVTVAIDIPLHGLPEGDPARVPGVGERTFDLDTTDDGVDEADGSGANFINLSNLLVSRDNLRQAVTDVINLNATLRAGDVPVFDATGTPSGVINLDNDNTHFVGHSLGGIIGSTVLGVTEDELGAASLAMPGSGIARLLDGSPAFGPTIAAGLAAAAGISEGTDSYELFLQFTQQVIDTTDPINHAEVANENHPVHMIEIVGGANGGNNPPDLVVPNFVVRSIPPSSNLCPSRIQSFLPFLDTVCESGPVSGTNPLVNQMGLDMLEIAPPYAAPMGQPSADTVIRFTAGHHGSILDPGTGDTPEGSVNPADAFRTTCEIQSQVANFIGQAAAGVPENSLTIPVGATNCTPPAP